MRLIRPVLLVLAGLIPLTSLTLRGTLMRREYDFNGASRGPVVSVPKGKTRITIRLDEDVVAWFKGQVHRAGGGNYQSLINAALREHIRAAGEPVRFQFSRALPVVRPGNHRRQG